METSTEKQRTYDEAVVTAKVHEAGGWEPVLRRLIPDVGPAFEAYQGSSSSHVHCPIPSHDDADPSFRIAENNGKLTWHCTCGKGGGNAYNLIAAIRNISYFGAINLVGDEVVAEPKHVKRKVDPAEHLTFRDWNESLVSLWAWSKPPITVEAVKAFGGRLATYRNQFQVIAIPIWGQKLDQAGPVGWILYPLNGGTLPKYTKGQAVEWVKVKVTYGSASGLVGPVGRIAEASGLWKLEGPTDALAVHAILPGDQVAITNSNGAKERPRQWILDLAAGKTVNVLHDADRPGQDGATFVGDEDGRKRPGWAVAFASTAAESRNLVLPYPIAPDHGKDVRDWLNEGKTLTDLEELADQAEPIVVDEKIEIVTPIRADNDPRRLAEVNFLRYSAAHDGATIRWWRDEFYIWKGNRYRKETKAEFHAKIAGAIQDEFDRLNVEDQKDAEKELKPAKQVTGSLVNNVILATQSLCRVSSGVELGTWIDDTTRERRNYIAMENGILDLDSLLAKLTDGSMEEICQVLREHSPSWFSTIKLPYRFDPDADCPTWCRYLDYVQEGDQERINLLQEWAGYLLTPDTGHQKFLALEGDGGNGKSVFQAAIQAIIGVDNCSHVPLEQFTEKFAKTQTLGKLANLATDVAELDAVAEATIKAFTGGDRMQFDRKFLPPVEACPTARLMVAFNNRPRFSDKSSGLWRRMMLCPFRIKVPEEIRVKNMDKVAWWEQSGELPGMFLWAVVGLHRLQKQGRFTKSAICDAAVKNYQEESNPASIFLGENYLVDLGGDAECYEVYDRYTKWCSDNGYRPLSDRGFGREVIRRFPEAKRERRRVFGERVYMYAGLRRIQNNDEDPEQ